MKIDLNGKDITKLVSSLSFDNSLEDLATTVSMTVPIHKDTDFNVAVAVGGKLKIDHEGNIFTGIVVETSKNDNTNSIKAMDIAFYLNKNKVLKQVRNITGKSAIKSICSDLGIPIKIDGLNSKINKIYKNETISDIIKDIVSQDFERTGTEYCIFALENTIYIEKRGKRIVDIVFKMSKDITLNLDKIVSSETVVENIEDLKNSILVTSSDSKSVQVLAKAKDGSSISKYGQLQEVVELEAKDVRKAKSVANTVLKANNKIKKELTIGVVSDKYVFSGQSIKYNKQKYLITSVSFSFNNGYFSGSLTLKEMV